MGLPPRDPCPDEGGVIVWPGDEFCEGPADFRCGEAGFHPCDHAALRDGLLLSRFMAGSEDGATCLDAVLR